MTGAHPPLRVRCAGCGRLLGTVTGRALRTGRPRTPLPDGEAIRCRGCRGDCLISDREVRAAVLAGRREVRVGPVFPVDLDGIDLDPEPPPGIDLDAIDLDPDPPWWVLQPDL